MELAARLPNGAAAYVDYAHTPDALERLLTALRPHTAGRLIVRVRRRRRPRPRQAAADGRGRGAPRRPSPSSPTTTRAARTRPRSAPRSWPAAPARARSATAREAIAAALNDLGAGDVLVVAGKGHEQGQTIGGTVLPFDDVGERPRAWPGAGA